MATYADFKEFKHFEHLDQLDMLEIYLTWDRYKQYHKMEFKEYLKDCDNFLNEIEEQVRNGCIFDKIDYC